MPRVRSKNCKRALTVLSKLPNAQQAPGSIVKLQMYNAKAYLSDLSKNFEGHPHGS